MDLKTGLIVAAVLVAGYSVFLRSGGGVAGSEARRMVEGGALLLDVRSPEEFASGHITGAINIPVDALDSRMAELGPKDKPVVVYCRSGNRSGRAADLLKGAGFDSIHDLGAMNRW